MTQLYTRDHKGEIRTWIISSDPITQTITTEHGLLHGAKQTKTEKVIPKAARTLEEQITLQVNSKISKKRDKGYTDYVPSTETEITNQLGTHKPMLAQRLDKQSPKTLDLSDVILQPKLDGNRCMITKQNGIVFAYSRNGKVIPADLSHITDPLQPILSEGMTLDGELYCHGETLQTIVSWIKKTRPETKRLMFHVYDLVTDDPYQIRANDLMTLFPNTIALPSIQLLVNYHATSGMDEITQYHKNILSQGFEGTIIRLNTTGYEVGKRSKSLLKLKSFMDDEYPVINIHESKDGWAILECLLPNSDTFRVTAPGTIEEKIHVLNNSHSYLGQMVHVEYANLTKDGIPFHPVATHFRNKHEE